MKRAVIQTVLLMCMLNGFAQSDTKNVHVQLYWGLFPANGINIPDTSVITETKARAVYGFKAEYMINQKISFGFVLGFQKINVQLRRANIMFEEGNVNKLYLGFRGLWHYGKGSWDLYSGIKMGYIYNHPVKVKTLPTYTGYLKAYNNDIIFQPGIIPFGAYYNFNTDMSAGLELSFGSPTVISAGIRKAL